MADRLEIVAVRVVDERGVVGLVVVRAQARRAVVLRSGRDGGIVKRVDGSAITASGGSWNAAIVAEVASWGNTQLTAHGLGAYIADKYGNRRAIIVASAFAAFTSYLLLAFVPGFHLILIVAVLAAALFAPIGPLVEVLSIEGSNHHGLDYGRIRLWASLSFLAGSLLSGALLEVMPVSSVYWPESVLASDP